MHKNNQNSKKFNKLITISLIIVILFLLNLGIDKYYFSKFNSSKWINLESKRALMINDMLENNDLNGMSKENILELLGQPSKTEKNMIIYYLGNEKKIISIDSTWFIIYFDDEKQLIEYKIYTD